MSRSWYILAPRKSDINKAIPLPSKSHHHNNPQHLIRSIFFPISYHEALSLFPITAILASFVAANPILAPRASSSPFRLYGDFGSDTSFPLLAILPVAERGYYQFGWYGKGSQKIELYFTQDETHPGPIFDFRKNGYEMYAPRSPRITPLTLLQGDASG